MAYIPSISNIAVAAIVLLALSASAQDATNSTPAKPATPEVKLSCVNAESIAFEPSKMVGDWYEVAIYPAPPSTIACAKFNIAAIPNTSDVALTYTYANDSKFLYVNETLTANASVAGADKPNQAGYNITFSNGNSSWPTIIYKLLATDYINYAIACSCSNATNNATEMGMVLTRDRMLNSTVIAKYGAMVSANYSNFVNTSMSIIAQSEKCLGNTGAVSNLPFLSAIMAAIYALLMWIN